MEWLGLRRILHWGTDAHVSIVASIDACPSRPSGRPSSAAMHEVFDEVQAVAQ
jgi:hypothetical protein